ncbi:hypothetical protein GCM10018966_066490 [Streptomyces yanii]
MEPGCGYRRSGHFAFAVFPWLSRGKTAAGRNGSGRSDTGRSAEQIIAVVVMTAGAHDNQVGFALLSKDLGRAPGTSSPDWVMARAGRVLALA